MKAWVQFFFKIILHCSIQAFQFPVIRKSSRVSNNNSQILLRNWGLVIVSFILNER